MAEVAGELGVVRSAAAAVLFLQGGMYTLDAYSTLNSSPWTAESFGGDPAKMKSLREYVAHAAVYSTAYCAAAALIGGSWWPVYGSLVNNAYLVFLYRRAGQRAARAGSTEWSSGGKASSASMLAWDGQG